MMVAAISGADPRNPNNGSSNQSCSGGRRSLSLDNEFVPRRPKSKQVSSRYMSPSPSTSTSTTTTTTTTTSSSSSSRRCASPLTNSTQVPIGPPRRAQSADRRRPTAARPVTPGGAGGEGSSSAAARLLITSTRSLSVSFQGEAFSLPISKTKSPPVVSGVRKATPERRRAATPVRGGGGGDQAENSKPGEQHRWPARARQVSSGSNSLSRSFDYSNVDSKKLSGVGSGVVARALEKSMVDDGRRSRSSFDGRLSLDLGNAERLRSVHRNPDGNSVNESDTDSVSSGSNSGVPDGLSRGKSLPRGIVVSAKFWQETNTRLRRLQDPGSPLSPSPVSRMGAAPARFVQSKKFGDSPLSSPRTTAASPIRGAATRPASPSKLWTSSTPSPSRGSASPSRARSSVNGPSSSVTCNAPSILSFSVDLRRGKIGESRLVDAHMLRLVYNRSLQWRFVNARADATSMAQKMNAEKTLWNAWVSISDLRHSVTLKRVKLLLLRKKLKLTSILRGQVKYLEEWALLDRDHSNSLLGATEALKASTLRLPISGKAVADVQDLKDAVGSAVDVMHAMASSICSLSSKVEGMNCLLLELANVTMKEQILLRQCKDFLSKLEAIQVKDCSLRTHILQLSRAPSTRVQN